MNFIEVKRKFRLQLTRRQAVVTATYRVFESNDAIPAQFLVHAQTFDRGGGQTRLIGSWHGEWPLVIVTARYSFAITSMSLRDFSFLYEISGSSLNISLSSGWFWIRCHLLVKISLRLSNASWYLVTRGRIFFRTLALCCKADFRSVI